jgi:hypothetical protein
MDDALLLALDEARGLFVQAPAGRHGAALGVAPESRGGRTGLSIVAGTRATGFPGPRWSSNKTFDFRIKANVAPRGKTAQASRKT